MSLPQFTINRGFTAEFLDTFKAPPPVAAQARNAIVAYARKQPALKPRGGG